MAGASSGSAMRSHNESLVIACLRDGAPMSRAQLAERLGLTRAAISRIIASMVERGLVQETGTRAAGGSGRPGRHLELSNAWVGIGLDARVDRTELVCLGMGGEVLRRETLDVPDGPSPEAFVSVATQSITALRESMPGTFTGIGVALPAKVSDDRLEVKRSHHFGWDDVPLAHMLSERVNLPVSLRHGAECAAVANARQPELIGSNRLLHVQVGSGLGLALTRNRDLDDTLPVGWGGAGHALLGDPKRLCICGRHGCVDTVVGFEAFAARGRAAGFGDVVVDQGMDGFAALVSREAAIGQCWALESLEELAEDLGRILAVFVTIEVPDGVTLGGYVTALGSDFLDRLDGIVSGHLLAKSPIVRTSAGADAPGLGAAMVGLSLIAEG